MPRKGCGNLQQAGRYLVGQLFQTNPLPFSPIHIDHWKYVPYVTQQDYDYARRIFSQNIFNTRQLRTIIRYAKKLLQP